MTVSELKDLDVFLVIDLACGLWKDQVTWSITVNLYVSTKKNLFTFNLLVLVHFPFKGQSFAVSKNYELRVCQSFWPW